MNIIPISGSGAITQFKSAFETQKTQGQDTGSFRSMFEGAVSELENLNAVKSQDAYNLALGNIDDIGAMQINSEKAETALQLFVEVRNKLLESYQEIMRINV